MMKKSDRDWREDFEHENGNYLCKCSSCGKHFYGHKRRVTCRLCSEGGRMKWESWELIKQMNALAEKSLSPELFERWAEINDHYKTIFFTEGLKTNIDDGFIGELTSLLKRYDAYIYRDSDCIEICIKKHRSIYADRYIDSDFKEDV